MPNPTPYCLGCGIIPHAGPDVLCFACKIEAEVEVESEGDEIVELWPVEIGEAGA